MLLAPWTSTWRILLSAEKTQTSCCGHGDLLDGSVKWVVSERARPVTSIVHSPVVAALVGGFSCCHLLIQIGRARDF